MRFDRRTAVITGGAIGFGRAFARALVAEGASVVIADVDVEMAERTAAELVDAGGKAIAVDCDVADPDRVDAAVATTIERFGGIDIVINNAGLHLMKYNQPFGVLSRNEIRSLFNVNVMGVINVTLACRDSMRDRGGGVVLNISSMAGYLSATPYAVSKLTVRGLTVAFATELAPDRIRVNTVVPGWVMTERQVKLWLDPEGERQIQENQCLKEKLYPPDIARMVLFLAAEDSRLCTAQNFVVDAGWT